MLKTRSDKCKFWHLVDAVFTPLKLNYMVIALKKENMDPYVRILKY